MINRTLPSSALGLYSRLAFLAFALAFVVIILGAYTRLSNAGLSCPDWPRCYGYLTPPLTTTEVQAATQAYPKTPLDTAKAWIEMRHRYLAGLEGLLILALVTLSCYWRKNLPSPVFKLSLSLVAILLGQVLLGRLTVTALLKPVIVLGHLLFGFSLLSILWVIWLYTKKSTADTKEQTRRWRPWIALGLLILIMQISFGGWVSTHYAGLACIDFPYCNGTLLPTLHWSALNTDLITIHMLHRLGALVTFIYLSLLSLCLIAQQKQRTLGSLLGLFLVTQITLGVVNILWLRPINIALPHHGVAALLLLTLLALLVNTYRQGRIT